jgi:hypothetical protein
MRILPLAIIVLLSSADYLKAQSLIGTPGLSSRPDTLLKVFYAHFPDHHTKKIHGRRYVNPYMNSVKHQFFKSRSPFEGLLFTMDDTLHCPDIIYDIYRDKLILQSQGTRVLIDLEEEFIRGFLLFEKDGEAEYEFIRYDLCKNLAGNLMTGYLQVLYDGERLDLLKKHHKFISETTDGQHYTIRFIKQERMILRKDNRSYPLRNNRGLRKLYPYAKPEVRRFLQKSRINIKYASGQQIQLLGEFLEDIPLGPGTQKDK